MKAYSARGHIGEQTARHMHLNLHLVVESSLTLRLKSLSSVERLRFSLKPSERLIKADKTLEAFQYELQLLDL